MAESYYTIAEVAARWRVSYDTIRREIDAGRLAYIKVGSQFRVKASAVEARERDEIQDGMRNVKRARRRPFAVASKDHYPDC